MRKSRSKLTPLARRLRQSDNVAESRLWLALRNRNLNGVKFFRQEPVGQYIADFASRDLKLVVELDGGQHIDNSRDNRRNQYMNTQGWSVARFPSGHMLSAPDGILETIAAICDGTITETIVAHDFQFYPSTSAIRAQAPHPSPLPASGARGLNSEIAHAFMRRAIALTRPGKTWPNPSVGFVLVKDGAVIAEGTTGDGGRPHAEEIALERAGAAAGGATAYVTLEPCGQRSSGAPSCSQRLIDAGVARVVYACEDPSPNASHQGPERLNAARVAVDSGLMAKAAQYLIAPTAHYYRTGLPLVEASLTPEGFDAEFVAVPDADLKSALADYAARGYRHLRVSPGSALAAALQATGLLNG